MFSLIKNKVTEQFATMDSSKLFVVCIPKGMLFKAYLEALPPEERQPHNCQCCQRFMNRYAGIVSIKNGKLQTLWDFEIDGLYSEVPKMLQSLIKGSLIKYPFLTPVTDLGVDFNFGEKEGKSVKYIHFHLRVPAIRTVEAKDIGKIRGKQQSTRQVFKRGLEEIKLSACETVLAKIEENSLYRGAQFKSDIENFVQFKNQYDALKTEKRKDLFTWQFFQEGGRIRNSSIGTLLVDLSEGRNLKSAIASYEEKVHPANYKTSTAEVSSFQVANAQKYFEESGYMDSLDRRHATDLDIPLEHLLFVNRNTVKKSAFDMVADDVKVDIKKFKSAPTVKLAEFISDVLPTAESIELFVDSDHNVVSLLAPVNPESKNMFTWDNQISWTYRNNLADAIAEKVKAKGGNVKDAELRITLEWYNLDDQDLHVIEPDGVEINFMNPKSRNSCGFLDVDENRRANTRTPVENIAYRKGGKIKEGKYTVKSNNYNKRENTGEGFVVQLHSQGKTLNFKYERALRHKESVEAVTFNYTEAEGITNVKTKLAAVSSEVSNAGTFQKVNMLMFSPNYWTNNIGNKHLFAILKDAKVNEELKPFFNEYLKADLQEHRKFIQTLATKLMVQPADNQLTGIGFSLTQNYDVLVKVNGKAMRIAI